MHPGLIEDILEVRKSRGTGPLNVMVDSAKCGGQYKNKKKRGRKYLTKGIISERK